MTKFNYDQPYIVITGLAEKNGTFLMVKEADGPDKGKWNFPAGKWDSGEEILDSVKREFEEETGCEFEPKSFLGVRSMFKEYQEKTNTLIRLAFTGTASGEANVSNNEISETKWFTSEEILNMTEKEIRSQDNKTIVKDYLEGKTWPLDVISHSVQINK